MLEQSWTLIQADDARSALALLEAITQAYVSDWTDLDDLDGEASEFFQELGPVWTEAVLSADLSSGERKAWAKKLESWQQEIDDYGVDEAFDAAHDAALQGWDDPQLQRVLQGTHSKDDSWDGEVAELTVARLQYWRDVGACKSIFILPEQKDSMSPTLPCWYTVSTQEAADYGRKHLETAQEALTLAMALYDRENVSKACKSLRAVSCSRDQKHLLQSGYGTKPRRWARKRWHSQPLRLPLRELSLDNYLRVAEIAGEQWLGGARICWSMYATRSHTFHKGKSMCSCMRDSLMML